MKTEHNPEDAAPLLPQAVRHELAQEDPAEQQKLLRAWRLAGHLHLAEPDDDHFRRLGRSVWANLDAALLDEAPARSPLRLVRPTAVRVMAVAATLALLFAAGLFLWNRSAPITVTAAPGEVAEVTLPDGSRVELNSGATLSYPEAFGVDARNVKLDGEGFFEVEKGTRPFVVETFNARTTVLGTSFAVRAWQDEVQPATVVTVASGAVRLANTRDEAAVTLRPGQTSRLEADATAPTAADDVNVERALGWRTGALLFVDQPLGKILREVERRFAVEIEVQPQALETEVLTVLIEHPTSAASILEDLSASYRRYGFRATPGGFELYRTD